MFAMRWPIIDSSVRLSELEADALPDFHEEAARVGRLPLPPLHWLVTDEPALYACAETVRLDDLCPA